MTEWSGRKAQAARAVVATWLPAPCGADTHKPGCPGVIDGTTPWVVGHKVARSEDPSLIWSVSNWRPESRVCSDASGQAQVIANAMRTAGFPHTHNAGNPRPVLSLPPRPRTDQEWTPSAYAGRSWLQGFLSVPQDASAPYAMTPPHPEAVDSWGEEAVEYARDVLGIELRWWQQLVLHRALEYRLDGSLCWRNVLLSCSRRSGKSVLLYVLLMYRLTHGFEPESEVVLTAGKMAQAKEIMRKCWRYAEHEDRKADGWAIRKANDSPEVETPGGDRILMRPTESTTGYSPSLALADEAWFIKPTYIDDDLAPSLMEREGGGQLWLVSTAHRRATSLMRGRIGDAMKRDDGKTLLLLWGAAQDADIADPLTWRAASPHWTKDREEVIGDMHARAVSGDLDPELDDPDPLQGFRCQFLNVWPINGLADRGDPVVSEDEWEDLADGVPDTAADAVAVESWKSDGVSVAYAWKSGVVHVEDYPDLASAAAVLKAEKVRRIIAGASLVQDPALAGLSVAPGTGRVTASVQELQRLMGEGAFKHSGEQHLTQQVLSVRTLPATDGIRIVSSERKDAIKAAVWAAQAARKPGVGKPRVLMPTG